MRSDGPQAPHVPDPDGNSAALVEPNTLREVPLPAPKLAALTGIRGYAAAWVVLYHFAHGVLGHQVPVMRSGHLGVDLFFVLSGFVLTLSYTNSLTRAAPGSVPKFMAARFFRIVPLNTVVLLAFLLVTPVQPGWRSPESPSIFNFVLALLLIQAWVLRPTVWNTPAWSLSCEWLAYLCFPIAVHLVCRLRDWRVAAGLSVALLSSLSLILIYIAGDTPGLNHVRTGGIVRCAGEFGAGMLLCRIWQLKQISFRVGTALLVAGLLVLGFACLKASFEYVAPTAFSLLVLSCASHSQAPKFIFGNRVTVWLGEISFSIYLLHWWLLQLAERVANRVAPYDAQALSTYLVIALALVVPLSWLSWLLIERPAQAKGRELINRRYSLVPPQTAQSA